MTDPTQLEDALGEGFHKCKNTKRGGKLNLVFGNTGFISYSHSRPGCATVYAEGTQLLNHCNQLLWDSSSQHAVQARMDSEQNQQQASDEAEASRAALARFALSQTYGDEPVMRVCRDPA